MTRWMLGAVVTAWMCCLSEGLKAAEASPLAQAENKESLAFGRIGPAKTNATYRSSEGVHLFKGVSGDVWGRADAFHFGYRSFEGDGTIVVRVTRLESANPWAKAGLMMRQSLEPDAPHVSLFVTPRHGFCFQYRAKAGEQSGEARRKGGAAARAELAEEASQLPCWLKLVKSGEVVCGYSSTNGETWSWEGTYRVPFSGALYVGVAMSGQDNWKDCEAGFDLLSVEAGVSPVADKPASGTGDGLKGNYFENNDHSGKALVRIDPAVDFDWTDKAPVEGMLPEQFSVRWEGLVEAQYSEPYAFHVVSDDRARLWVNGRLVIDETISHAAQESTGLIQLEAGKKYVIRLDYVQNERAAVAKLLWSSPSTPKEVIPRSQLYSDLVDSDGDGMPDQWENQYGLNPKDPRDADQDKDGDGWTNLQEYMTGRNPLVADRDRAELPAPWKSEDVGHSRKSGRVRYSQGAFSLVGNGTDIWGNADGFHFVHQTLVGDGEIVGRVVSLLNTHPWAKAGLMMRHQLREDSRQVLIALAGEQGVSFQCRTNRGGVTTEYPGGAATVPCWLKLVRRGNDFIAYRSEDGVVWKWVATEAVEMGSEVEVGLALSSHNPEKTCTAVIEKVSMRAGVVERAGQPVVGTGDGLSASYYELQTEAMVSRVDPTVDFDWSMGAPVEGIRADCFSVRWEGVVEAQYSEPYTFHVITDDGARLWVDGEKVLDGWSDRAATKMSTTVPLRAGHKYLLKMEYYERLGEAVAKLHWSSPSTPRQPIPQSQLYSPAHPIYQDIDDKDHDGMPDRWEQLSILDDTDPKDAKEDDDEDGLTNLEEYLNGTNPQKADTDGDRMPDGWETSNGLNPLDPADAQQDDDQDGLTNLQEYRLGTDPQNADTDLDGLPDGVEVNETHTSPLSSDSTGVQTVVELTGASRSEAQGVWVVDGEAIRSQELRGWVEYTVAVPTADVYRLEIEGRMTGKQASERPGTMLVSVDGACVGRIQLRWNSEQDRVSHCFTPWIQPGTHKVRVEWDNSVYTRFLRIQGVRLQRLLGKDANQNGISDWVDSRLSNQGGLRVASGNASNGQLSFSTASKPVVVSSLSSPFCLEGRGQSVSMMSFEEGQVSLADRGSRWFEAAAEDWVSREVEYSAASYTALPVAGGGWCANVPLVQESVTAVKVNCQNGGAQEWVRIKWQPLNVLQSTDLVVRQGDALLLGVAGEKSSGEEKTEIAIAGVTNYQTLVKQPVPHVFAQAGVYSITGTFYPADNTAAQTKTITVKVVGAAFNGEPACWVGRTRSWECPNLPGEAVVETDPEVSLEETRVSGEKGRAFLLGMKEPVVHFVSARLGTNGPILAGTRVWGINFNSSGSVDLHQVTALEDGTQVIEMVSVLSALPPDVEIEISIVVAGVTFDDGTIVKRLRAADFNKLGINAIRFLRSSQAKTSVCHQIRIYQNGVLVGGPY